MFRMWGKIWKENHLLRDVTVSDESGDNRTKKVFRALETICYELDLPQPIWLDMNVTHFQKHARTRFSQDSFIEPIDFDYLEIQVIQED